MISTGPTQHRQGTGAGTSFSSLLTRNISLSEIELLLNTPQHSNCERKTHKHTSKNIYLIFLILRTSNKQKKKKKDDIVLISSEFLKRSIFYLISQARLQYLKINLHIIHINIWRGQEGHSNCLI